MYPITIIRLWAIGYFQFGFLCSPLMNAVYSLMIVAAVMGSTSSSSSAVTVIPAVLLFSAGAVIAGGIIFSLWTLRIQCGGMYSPERAVVVRQNAQLRSIPANDGGESALLPGGSMLRIREESGGFYRVESGSVSGRIARDAVERIWPYGVF